MTALISGFKMSHLNQSYQNYVHWREHVFFLESTEKEQQTETRQVHGTDLCGTPQANTAVTEMRKSNQRQIGK